MVELAAQKGYQGVSIAEVSARAGVSSATFYKLFPDKEACAHAAYRAAAERVIERLEPVDSSGEQTPEEWQRSATEVLHGLLSAVSEDSAAARLLFVEALAGGPRFTPDRRAIMSAFQQRAEAFLRSPPPAIGQLDIPASAFVGGVRSIVSRHLRTSAEDQLPALARDLVAWVRSYAVPAGRTPWSTGPRARLPMSADRAPARTAAPRRLPRGRHRLPASVIARSHRTRIIHATAEVMLAKGYAETTVSDIVAAAGVSRHVFYEHFADKQDAFLEAQNHPTQHILDTFAAAYFAAESWPERVWGGLQTLLALIVASPALAHLRLVECYAAGPTAIRRAEEVTRSFTIFLEEGFRAQASGEALPRLTSQAVSGAVFEIIQRRAARGDLALVPSLLPQLTYIAVAPYIGAEEAIARVEELAGREQRGARA